jgi:ABC-2 type transport system permease protein
MEGSFFRRLLTATRFALFEQARNRFAIGLLLIFVPLWYYLFGLIVPGSALAFRFWATGTLLEVNGQHLTYITAGMNAITLIVGFMFFASTHKGILFDRRLVLSGYPQTVLILAKVLALGLVTSLISLYASLILYLFWQPGHPVSLPLIWLGFWAAALIYGSFGMLLGVLLTNELAGFFLVIMLSLIDTSLQNPIGNPIGNQPILREFPSFGAMQLDVAGGFTALAPWRYFWLSLAWWAGFAALGLLIFWWRTHARRVQVQAEPASARAALSIDPAPAPQQATHPGD